MKKKPDILSTEICTQSRLFIIETVDLCFSNGERRQFERVRGRAHGSIMIVPMLDDMTVLLIREYANGIDDYVLAFPKGAVETDEELFITANRELMEEVGYGAREFSLLTQVSASPSYMSSMMQVIVAKDLYPCSAVGDEPETIEVIPWSLTQVDELLAHPQFHEARSIAALLLVERQRYAG